MPAGAGACPAGSCPAGYGTIDVAAPPAKPYLPDWVLGTAASGRLFDLQTRDYRYTADGRVVGMATVPQLVLLALASAPWGQIQEKGVDYQRRLATVAQNALAPLIQSKQVAIISVTATDSPPGTDPAISDGTVVNVQWRDLTTQIQQTTTV